MEEFLADLFDLSFNVSWRINNVMERFLARCKNAPRA